MRNRKTIAAALSLISGIAVATAQKQITPKSKGEQEAVMAMFNAQDPDARIKAAENLLTKYADTEFKPIALQFEAASYQQKNDYEKMVIFAERAIEADPKNFMAMLMMATGIAQHTRETDLDREEKLTRAEKYGKSALDALKDAAKPNPQITDDQWTAAKKDFDAQAHESFGMIALVRKKYDVAVTEFKTAVDNAAQPDPAAMVRLAAAYNMNGKPDEALAVADKVMAMPDLHPSIKQFAQAEKVRATQAKSGGAKPSSTQPPAQVEIKKP